MLNSQDDQERIFSGASGQNLQILNISNPVDDTAWAIAASGTLYASDSGADTVDAITGSFTPERRALAREGTVDQSYPVRVRRLNVRYGIREDDGAAAEAAEGPIPAPVKREPSAASM